MADTPHVRKAGQFSEKYIAYTGNRSSKSFEPTHAEISMEPSTTVALVGKDAEQMLRLADALEDLDDVQNFYANFDISEQEMANFA